MKRFFAFLKTLSLSVLMVEQIARNECVSIDVDFKANGIDVTTVDNYYYKSINEISSFEPFLSDPTETHLSLKIFDW